MLKSCMQQIFENICVCGSKKGRAKGGRGLNLLRSSLADIVHLLMKDSCYM